MNNLKRYFYFIVLLKMKMKYKMLKNVKKENTKFSKVKIF